MHTNKNTIVV